MRAQSSSARETSPAGQLVSLRQSGIAEIRRRIISGELPAGVNFSEAEISDALGISRAPVREALIVLAQLGWVTAQPRSGYLVAPMTLSDLRELYTLRTLLEPKAAALAAKNQARDGEQTAALAQFSEHGDDPSSDDWLDDHYRFHRRIAILGHNRELDRTLGEVHLKLERYFAIDSVNRALSEELIDHRPLADAILSADPRAASDAATAHIATAQLVVTEAILATDGILSMPLKIENSKALPPHQYKEAR